MAMQHRTERIILLLVLSLLSSATAYAASPSISSITLSTAPYDTNGDDENLSAYIGTSDSDGDNVSVAVDWRVANSSIITLNLNFDANNSAGSGATRDYSKNNYSVQASNSGMWNATTGLNRTGGFDFGKSYPTYHDYLYTGNNAGLELYTGTFTFEAWVKSKNVGRTQTIFGYSWQDSDLTIAADGVSVTLNANGTIKYAATKDGSTTSATSTSAFTQNNTWYHVTIVSSLDNISIYLDGNVAGNGTVVHADDPGIGMFIGGQWDVDDHNGFPSESFSVPFNGSIDNFHLWNRALSSEQVLMLSRSQNTLISSAETAAGQNWSVCATPNDGSTHGATTCSSTINILTCGTTNITLPRALTSNNVTCDDVYVMNGTSLSFIGNISLRARDVYILNGTVNHSTLGSINITAKGLTVAADGTINATGKGYTATTGPGAGSNDSGAAHGGRGAYGSVDTNIYYNFRDDTYGNITHPVLPGSGGATWTGAGGAGGGVVRLNVTGTMDLTGVIDNRGNAGGASSTVPGAGGSGGSVLIFVNTFVGTGSVSVDGGQGLYDGVDNDASGAGGAGRIATHYASRSFTGVMSAKGGAQGYASSTTAGAGTIYSVNLSSSDRTLEIDNANITASTTATTTINDSHLGDPIDRLIVTNATVNGTRIQVMEDLIVNPGTVYLNNPITGTSNVTVTSGGVLRHTSTSAYSLNITAANIIVESGGTINTSGNGYAAATGPGAGVSRGGGSHASMSGASATNGAANTRTTVVYGNVTHPKDHGSGAGAGDGTDAGGGGVIFLNATGSIANNGTITSEGERGGDNGAGPGGGGAGGSIWLQTVNLEGTGVISVRGGDGGVDADDDDGGGGAGGRLAIYYSAATFNGTLNAYGGQGGTDAASQDGGPGTVYLYDRAGGIEMFRIDGGVMDITQMNLTANTTKGDFANLNLSNVTLTGVNIASPTITIHGKNVTTYINLTGNTTILGGAMLSTYGVLSGGNVTLENGSNMVMNGTTSLGSITVFGNANFSNLLTMDADNINLTSNNLLIANAPIIASDITLESGGIITNTEATMSVNRSINITAENIIIAAGATINASGKGYTGGGGSTYGTGPGAGTFVSSRGGGGASHAGNGGHGGATTNGNITIYGNLTHPTTAGSGGSGSWAGAGGDGGGVIFLNLTGTLTNDGAIDVRGTNGTNGDDASGAGSGGSIWISASTITGSGVIDAGGGNGGNGSGGHDAGGGGAGGRIALHFSTNTMTGRISNSGGNGGMSTGSDGLDGGGGTTYLYDRTTGMDTLQIDNSRGEAPDTTAITNLTAASTKGIFSHLNVSNATIRGLTLTITHTLTANPGLVMLDSPIIGTSNITVMNGSTLTHTQYSDANPYWLNLTATNLVIAAGGAINLTARGYAGGGGNGVSGTGPGAGTYVSSRGGGGASHAGIGGNGGGTTNGNTTIYGDLIEPITAGSGGSGAWAGAGGDGGGIVLINLTGTLTVDGGVQSDGENGTNGDDAAGAGSGGSIRIRANTIAGAGPIIASGGIGGGGPNDEGGSGAGGRISLQFATYTHTGTVQAPGREAIGNGGAGNPGTVFRCQFSSGMSCPGSISTISLSTFYLYNQSVNITRNLTMAWSDTLMVWNETSTHIATVGQYIISGLTQSNYKVWHNTTFNDSLYITDGVADMFETNISGMMQIKVLAPNNTAPYGVNVTLNGSRNGPLVYPNEDLLCSVNVSDRDDFYVTASWTMYNGSVEYNSSKTNVSTNGAFTQIVNISNTITNPGETWTCGVIISDSYDNLAQVNHSRTLEITAAPVFESISITPQPAYTNDTLLGWCNASDVDGDLLVYHYAWYKEGVLNSSGIATNGSANYTQGILYNVANLTYSNTSRGQNWTFQCMGSQSIANSSARNTSIIIQNYVPYTLTLSINTSNLTNTTAQDIQAHLTTSGEADGNTINAIYNWKVNGTGLLLHNLPMDINNSGGTGASKGYTDRLINATATGAVWNETAGLNGSGAYQFDGADDYLTITDAYDPTSYTIEVWVKPRDNTDVSITVFSTGAPTSSYTHILGITTGSVATHYVYWSSGSSTVTGTSTIPTNQWTHIVGTAQQNGFAKLYVNGVEEGTPSAMGTPSGATYWYIGTNTGLGAASEDFNGTIDGVRIWNRSLTSEQVLLLYQNRTDRFVAQETGAAQNWSACVTLTDDQNETGPTCSSVDIVAGSAPSASPTMASASGRNSSSEDLIVTTDIADADPETTFSAIDWRVNGTSIAILNMNFDTDNSNGSSSTADYSTYGTNGTISGAQWRERQGVMGSGAYEFDGRVDYINLGNKSWLNFGGTNQMTLAAWVKPYYAPNGAGVITEQYTGAGDRIPFALGFYEGSGGPWVGFYNGSAWSNVANSTVPTTNAWTHYAGTWNGSHMILYVNGVAVNTTIYTNQMMPTTGIQQFWIGRRHDTAGTIDFFPGLIDEVIISNRTYSPEQILALAQNQTYLLDAAETSPGDNWTACVTPNDGWNQGTTACTTGLIIADGVLMRSVSVTPTVPNTNDTVLGWCNGTSGLSDNVAYYWQWFNNSAMVAEGHMDNGSANYSIDLLVNVANISAANTTKDDVWVFSCMAAYGGVNSSWMNSSVTINNTAPVLSAVTINSTLGTNTPDENLSLYTTTYDDDNDFIRRAIDWRVDGDSIYSINMNFDINNSNGAGSTKSHSSWGNNGSITGATWTRTGGVNGTGAYDFDASGDYIRIPHDMSIKPGFGNLTFFAWIYPESPNDNVRVGNDRGTAAAGTQRGWQLKINDINSTHWMIYDSGIDSDAGAFKGCAIDYCDGGNWTLNEWHHIGFVYVSDDKIRWYVDGVNFLNTTVGAYGNISSDLPVALGAAIAASGTEGTVSQLFNGRIDDIVLSLDALSEDEVRLIYTNRPDILLAEETFTDQVWTACVTPNDGVVQNETICSSELTITNGVATESASITPTTAYTADTLLGWCNGTNALSTNISYHWQWYKNNTLNTSGYSTNGGSNYTQGILVNIANISASNTTSGDVWAFSCLATYSIYNGTWSNSSSQTVSNTLPAISSFTVTSDSGTNATTENLTAAVTSSDNDTDPVRLAIDWRLNGTSIAVLNMNFDTNNSNGTGSTRDYSTHGNNGSASGATWNATAGYNGTGAYYFDGNDQIVIPDDPTLRLHDFTISAWLNAISYSNYRTALAKTAGGTWDDGFGISHSTGANDIRCWVNVWDANYASTTLEAGEWHHIACTYNHTHIAIYKDGALMATDAYTGNFTQTTNPLRIGNGEGYYWYGYVDEVLIYNHSLSGAQILALSQNRTDVIVAEETELTQNWTACVTPNDGLADGTTTCTTGLTITDGLTTISSSITPTTAYTADTLLGWCNGTNALSTNISYHWQWYKNNTLNTSGYTDNSGTNYTQGLLLNIANISASNTTSGDVWAFSCLATYGSVNSTWTNSSPQAISNTPPSVTSLTVTSDSGTNTTDEDLTAAASINDDDTDPTNIAIDWRVNSTSIATINYNFDVNNSAGDGITRDHTSYGNNGTITGNFWSATAGRNATGAFNFGATTGNYISIPKVAINGGSDISLSFWIKSSDVTGRWAVSGANSGNDNELLIGFASGTVLRFYDGQGDTSYVDFGISDVEDDAWHHIVLVRDDTNDEVSLYIDGVADDENPESRTMVALAVDDGGFILGQEQDSVGGGFSAAQAWSGLMDDFALYNRSLSAAQVLSLYQNRTDILVAEETELTQNWTACVTPNDGLADGTTTCTTGLLITEITDSCTPPAINTNWLVYAGDNCTKSMTSIDLGAGNLTVSGEQGAGYLRFNNTNLTASNVNILGYGNLSRIIIENGGRVSIS